jgi:hypothetical protein
MIHREWELWSYAVDETKVAWRVPETDALEQLKAWVVDGKVQAKGHWPDRPGIASSTDPVCILPAKEFRFVDRTWNRLLFLRPMKIVDDVEINIVQLRQALGQPAVQATAAPVRKSRKAKLPLRPRGNPGTKKIRIIAAMREMDRTELCDLTLKALAHRFGAAQSTCKEARDTVLE